MANTETATFGHLLRRYRQLAGLTQETLAEQAGLSTNAVASLESGRRTSPRLETVSMLATALQLAAPERRALIEAATGISTGTPQPADQPGVTDLPSATETLRSRRIEMLPLQPTALIGREHEEAAVLHLLRETSDANRSRLISLIGPGGVGKTHLALAVAAAASADFGDGVVFVDLSALRDETLVLSTIAQTLRLREDGSRSEEAILIDYLRELHLLLVLDNLEQVVEAAPLLIEIVTACPRLVLLATSRIALRVRGEQRFHLGPLATPPPETIAPPAQLALYGAVQMFAARAAATQPNFALDESNAATVAAICARLDGLPLAIELAAMRVSLLSPSALLTRLEEAQARWRLLSGGARDLPVRQQALRTTLDWSYSLLTGEEQALLRRLAVFANGCTIDAAEAICQEAQAGSTEFDAVLNGLASLADKSLLRLDGPGTGPRIAMLETIREYAFEQLAAAGEAGVLGQRHANYYLALAERVAGTLIGAQQATALEQMDGEHDNLRAALRWAQESDAVESGLRLVAALWRFWYMRGHLREGRGWLHTFLSRPLPGADTRMIAVRARALAGAGVLANLQADYDGANALCEEALALYREIGDREGEAVALNILGNIAMQRNDNGRAIELSEASLALQRALGNRRGIAVALNNLGHVLRRQGDYERAGALYEESLALNRALGDGYGVAYVLDNIADLARDRGDYDRAITYYTDGLTLHRQMGNKAGIASCLEEVAEVINAQGDPQRATRLFAAAMALGDSIGMPLPSVDRARYDRLTATLRSRLGDSAFDAAWRAGLAIDLEQAIVEATRQMQSVAAADAVRSRQV